MCNNFKNIRFGYTITELMVVVLIVSILATTVGVFFVKLLTIQEQDREEAYLQEMLTNICGTLADYMSVGSSITTISSGANTGRFDVNYRQETGGVFLETGRVDRSVAKLTSIVTATNGPGTTLDLHAYEYKKGLYADLFPRIFRGDNTPLIPINGFKELEITGGKVDLRCSLTPFNASTMAGAPLWSLRVIASYEVTDIKGKREEKTVSSERVIRLWNWEDRTQ